MVAALIALHRRLPVSHFVHVCVFLHILILIYGGYYTYAMTPLGNWAKQAFDLSRNHYDRVGHLALGVFPSFLIREVLLRSTPLVRGGWLYFWSCVWCSRSQLSGSYSNGGRRWFWLPTPGRPFSARRAMSGMRSGTCCWLWWARRSSCRCSAACTIGRWSACRSSVMKKLCFVALVALGCAAAPAERTPAPLPNPPDAARPELRDPREIHFAELEQLTFGGENAEAYWSFRGDQLIFQRTRPPLRLRPDLPDAGRPAAAEPVLVSTRQGPHDLLVLSSRATSADPLLLDAPRVAKLPDAARPLAGLRLGARRRTTSSRRAADGSELRAPDRDARATTPRRRSARATARSSSRSMRDGDLELYRMDSRRQERAPPDERRPATTAARSSRRDCSEIVWRASRPRGQGARRLQAACSREGLVRPTRARDLGRQRRRQRRAPGHVSRRGLVRARTSIPTASASSSRRTTADPRGREFDIWAVNVDGTGLERHHVHARVRRLPDVLARRQAARVRRRTATRTRRARPTCSSPTGRWARAAAAAETGRRSR